MAAGYHNAAAGDFYGVGEHLYPDQARATHRRPLLDHDRLRRSGQAMCHQAGELSRDANPRVRISFETGLALTRFDSTGPDLAIRYGAGRWPGLTAHHLMDEELFPAAAPTLPGINELSQVKAIAKLPLITDLAFQGWPDWFRAAGLRAVGMSEMHTFTDSTDAMRASVSGLGAILARSRLAEPYLRSGELARLPGPAVKARFGYYAIHPTHQRPSPSAAAFIHWARHEAALDASVTPIPSRVPTTRPKR